MANTFTTNASYPKPIDESIIQEDFGNLQEAHNDLADNLESHLTGIQSAADAGINSTVPDAGFRPVVALQLTSDGSITSIAGAILGKPITFLMQSIGSFQFADEGNFLLSAAFAPTEGDTLTLVWDGTNFVEIARSANG